MSQRWKIALGRPGLFKFKPVKTTVGRLRTERMRELGESAKWWKEMQRVFVTSNIVSLDQRFLVVSDRLRGDAPVAFWQIF